MTSPTDFSASSAPTTPDVSSPVAPVQAENVDPMEELSNSPFAKMFPLGATRKQVKEFIDNYLKMIISDIKRADERIKRAQKRFKNAIEGRRDLE